MIKDGEPTLVFEGTHYVQTYWMVEDWRIFYMGRDGAAVHMAGTYHLTKDGEIECEDYYFSIASDQDSRTCYTNSNGEIDIEKSEKTDIESMENFEDETGSLWVDIETIPLAELK